MDCAGEGVDWGREHDPAPRDSSQARHCLQEILQEGGASARGGDCDWGGGGQDRVILIFFFVFFNSFVTQITISHGNNIALNVINMI